MDGQLIYLDHAAATPLDKRVLDAMRPYFSDNFFNPSSPYAPAVAVRSDIAHAKARLAATFGAKGDELVMTAGATESINLALNVDGHIVTSSIEHDAVLAAAKLKEHTLVAPTEKGIITADAVDAAITPETERVSVQLANNEIGTIQPIRDIASVVAAERNRRREAGESRPIYFHCDASQGFGQLDVNVARLGIDLLTLNSGKMYGPKQVGLLWVKPGIVVHPFILGGGQERGLRSGTENVAGIIGFSVAAEVAHQKHSSEAKRLTLLRDSMQMKLQEHFGEVTVSGHPKKRLAGSLHVSFPGLDGERLVFILENSGVLLATGSACAANKGTRSHVLTAIGMDDKTADGSLRITLGRLSNEDNTALAVQRIIEAVELEQKRLAHA